MASFVWADMCGIGEMEPGEERDIAELATSCEAGRRDIVHDDETAATKGTKKDGCFRERCTK